MPQFEQFVPRRTSRGLSRQDRIGCKQRREQNNVAQQENPKAVGNDYANRRRAVRAHAAVGAGALAAAAERSHIHGRALSALANCSPDTTVSIRSAHPNATKVSAAHTSPS